MEITRKLVLNTSSLPGTPFIIVTDINNSILCNKVDKCLRTVSTTNNPTKMQQQQQQQRTQATNFVVTAVQEVLIGVLDELQTTLLSGTKPTKVYINLNLYHRQFSISYWDSLITWVALPSVLKLYQQYDTESNFVDYKVNVYVTFQTDVDKQRYVESAMSTLRQFRERMDIGLSEVQNMDLLGDDEREFLTKLVLLNLFRRKNLEDDEIERLLGRNSCVAEVLDELYSSDPRNGKKGE